MPHQPLPRYVRGVTEGGAQPSQGLRPESRARGGSWGSLPGSYSLGNKNTGPTGHLKPSVRLQLTTAWQKRRFAPQLRRGLQSLLGKDSEPSAAGSARIAKANYLGPFGTRPRPRCPGDKSSSAEEGAPDAALTSGKIPSVPASSLASSSLPNEHGNESCRGLHLCSVP